MKAIIPAAGMGTRLLPLTKTIPKEMLPIVNKPAIQYVVEEAVKSGISDILVVSGRNKKAMEDYFDKDPSLEQFLESRNKQDLLNLVRKISELADLTFIRQKEPLGLGHAILITEKFVNKEPFVVLLGDDIFIGETPLVSRLINFYNKFEYPVIAVKEVGIEEVSKYGIVSLEKDDIGFRILDAVEKPSPDKAPSNYAIVGRYLFTPSIFDYLKKISPDENGELQLTDAIREMVKSNEKVYAMPIVDLRIDVGTIESWLNANLKIAKLYGFNLLS